MFRVCLLIVSLALGVSHADQESKDALVQLLEQSDHFQADFVQRTYKPDTPSADESKGKLWVSRPLKFRWSVVEPFEQHVISDGETLWVHDPDLEQATYQPVSDNISQSPAMILAQPGEALSGPYEVIQAKSDELTAFKLYPASEESLFESISLIFINDQLDEFRLQDSLGQETVIQFSNVSVDAPSQENPYEFVAPPGTDLFPQM